MRVEDIQIGSHVFVISSGIYEVRSFQEMYGSKYLVLDAVDLKNKSTLFIPCDKKDQMDKICELKTKDELVEISKSASELTMEWNENRRERQQEFNDILRSNSLKNIVSMIRCLTKRSEELKENNKRLSSLDNEALMKGKYLLVQLISYAFKIDKHKAEDLLESKI